MRASKNSLDCSRRGLLKTNFLALNVGCGPVLAVDASRKFIISCCQGIKTHELDQLFSFAWWAFLR